MWMLVTTCQGRQTHSLGTGREGGGRDMQPREGTSAPPKHAPPLPTH